jgi:hypothetical protein
MCRQIHPGKEWDSALKAFDITNGSLGEAAERYE